MKRKLFVLIGILVLIGLVVVVIKTLRDSAPRQGVLKINSTPAASIFLDNKLKGKTPLEEKVEAGEYVVKLVPESPTQSASTWQGKITVAPNLLTYVNRDLAQSELLSAGEVLWLEKITSKQSEITLTTVPDGAAVLLNDETKGSTPLALTDITPGDYTVTVTSPGFLARTLKIRTTAGFKLNAVIQLALSPVGLTPTVVERASPSAAPVVPSGTGTPTPTPTKKLTASPTQSATVSGAVSTDPPKPYVVIKDTPTGFLRVREEPETGSKELTQVQPGQKFTYFDVFENGAWFKIKYDGTNSGWVSGQYVEKVE